MENLRPNETAVDRLQASDILPITRIKEVFGAPIDDREIRAQNKDRFDNKCQRLSAIYQIFRLAEEGHLPIAQIRNYIPLDMQIPGYFVVMKAYRDAKLDTPVYSQTTFTGRHKGKEVYNLHLAHFSDEELHFGDITLQNVRIFLSRPEQERFRTPHPGLGSGIFDETLENLFRFARENGYKRISLSAVDMLRAETMAKRGFEFRPGPLLNSGLARGMSIPMVREL